SDGGLARVDFKSRFGSYDGCFIIREIGQDWTLRYNEAGCAKPLSPCSTFKVFNSLTALETGVVKAPDPMFKWDVTPQPMKAWEQDHTLATAVRDSVVWYFQRVAEKVGDQKMKELLAACNYGNQDISGGLTKFWLDSSLKISAQEQVDFLERLYTNKLPFS